MKPSREVACPRTEALSALIDGELAPASRDETVAHATVCPVCGSMLQELNELRLALKPLAELPASPDLAPLIEQRLSAAKPVAATKPRRKGWLGWQLLPAGLAGAATLSAGVYLGALLAGGTGAAMQPAMMAMFDAIPPGGVCLGVQSCNRQGR